VTGLFDKRLLIFSGKGGAGKSTVAAAAAAAVAAARRGKRVLIVEIGDEERIPSIFRNAKKSGYAGGRVSMPRPTASRRFGRCASPPARRSASSPSAP
jgi:CO dehydrogenase nickel-insertion accessory protein CooC1